MTTVEESGRDFFVSHASADRAWADWIAVQLERAGYTTIVQSFDFRPGTDFLHLMQKAAATAGRTIAILSPAYFASRFGEAEWRAAFAQDPTGENRVLIPVRVEPCDPPGLLSTRVYVDLVDTDEVDARHKLLDAVDPNRPRPTTAVFPGTSRPTGGSDQGQRRARYPGAAPMVSNLPARNRTFSGRNPTLQQLHTELQVQSSAAVLSTTAVHGLGGVGKTHLAIEYAHRYASDYDLIWWINADQPTTAAALVALSRRLGLPQTTDQTETIRQLFDELRSRDRWLLVYDNAESPTTLDGLLPEGGGGHVLITSRWSAWATRAAPIPLDVLARQESIEFLQRAHPRASLDPANLAELADLLGDLPLALEEAAAYLDATHSSPVDYIDLLRSRARDLFGLDNPSHGPDTGRDQRRVATVWTLSLDTIHQQAPAAEGLLTLLAFLAPNEVPRTLPTTQPDLLPEPLQTAVTDPVTYNHLIATIGRYSLATATPTHLGIHRLVQTVIHARLDPDAERRWATTAVDLIDEAFPSNNWDISWPTCEQLLPHLLAVTGHAYRLGVAGQQAARLLDRASTYLQQRPRFLDSSPPALSHAGQASESGPVAESVPSLPEPRISPRRTLALATATAVLAAVALTALIFGLNSSASADALLEPLATVSHPMARPDWPSDAIEFVDRSMYIAGLEAGDVVVTRYDLPDPQPVWRTITEIRANEVGTRLRSFGDTMILEAVVHTPTGSESSVIGLKATTGERAWRHDDYYFHIPVSPHRVSLHTSPDHSLEEGTYSVVDTDSGRIVWSSATESVVAVPLDTAPPEVADPKSLFGSFTHDAARFRLHEVDTGAVVHEASLGEPIVPPAGPQVAQVVVVDQTVIVERYREYAVSEIVGLAIPELAVRWRHSPNDPRDFGSVRACHRRYVCREGQPGTIPHLDLVEARTNRLLWAASKSFTQTEPNDREFKPLLRDDRILTTSSTGGFPAPPSELHLVDSESGEIVSVRRDEFPIVTDSNRVLLLPNPTLLAPSDVKPSTVAQPVSIMHADSGTAYQAGRIETVNASTCAASSRYLACQVDDTVLRIWRIPDNVTRNPTSEPRKPNASVPEPPTEPGPITVVQGAPPLPTLHDVTHAEPAESVWAGAVRHVPDTLPNGQKYGVVAELAPGRFVVQEAKGPDQLGNVHLFQPASGELSPLFDGSRLAEGGAKTTGQATMAGIGHLVVTTSTDGRDILWVVEIASGRVVQQISNIVKPENNRAVPPYAWVNGSLMWSLSTNARFDQFGTGGIWHGNPAKRISGTEGYQLLNSAGDAIKAENKDGTRHLERWNLLDNQRTSWSAPGSEKLNAVNCQADWCVGVGGISYPEAAQEFRVFRPNGATGTSTVGAPEWNLPEPSVGRFHVLGPMATSPYSAPSLLWDSQTGRVGTVPGFTEATVPGGYGADVIPLTDSPARRTILVLNAIPA